MLSLCADQRVWIRNALGFAPGAFEWRWCVELGLCLVASPQIGSCACWCPHTFQRDQTVLDPPQVLLRMDTHRRCSVPGRGGRVPGCAVHGWPRSHGRPTLAILCRQSSAGTRVQDVLYTLLASASSSDLERTQHECSLLSRAFAPSEPYMPRCTGQQRRAQARQPVHRVRQPARFLGAGMRPSCQLCR